jgi:hypothetical protein
MITITGLWLNKSKKGEMYMSGYFGNARCFVFKNQESENEKAPEYRLVIADPPDKEGKEGKDPNDKPF